MQGSGIGRETVLAFASAGAAHVALLGRSESALTETASTASSSYPQTKTSIHAVDIADEAAAAKVAADIGTWDVLIHGAGHVSEPSTIASANVADFWKSFEVGFAISRCPCFPTPFPVGLIQHSLYPVRPMSYPAALRAHHSPRAINMVASH